MPQPPCFRLAARRTSSTRSMAKVRPSGQIKEREKFAQFHQTGRLQADIEPFLQTPLSKGATECKEFSSRGSIFSCVSCKVTARAMLQCPKRWRKSSIQRSNSAFFCSFCEKNRKLIGVFFKGQLADLYTDAAYGSTVPMFVDKTKTGFLPNDR